MVVTADTTVDGVVNENKENGDIMENLTSGIVTTGIVKGKRGRPAKAHVTIALPTTATFTLNDILTANPTISKPTLYLLVKSDSRLKKVGTQANTGGRGKPACVFGLADAVVVA